jgi:predicted glycogen debranching enzyme
MKYNVNDWPNLEAGMSKEYFLTDGYGGFLSSTILGINTRRYHGIDHRSLRAPVDRHIFISKIAEEIVIGGESYRLNPDFDESLKIKDLEPLQCVEVGESVVHSYKLPNHNIFIKREMIKARKTGYVAISYEIINSTDKKIYLNLYPYCVDRDHHKLRKDMEINIKQHNIENGVCYSFDRGDCYMEMENAVFEREDSWTPWLYYPVEKLRGLDFKEKAFVPTKIKICVKSNTRNESVLYLKSKQDEHFFKDIKEDLNKRMDKIVKKSGFKTEFGKELVRAADKFIVHRKSTENKTIIAGYPWFTDWGRDTMIAFPGITLATKRFGEAKSILISFSKYLKDGLIPNMFPDENEEPLYNTCDATLWYFIACYKYYKETGDKEFIESIYTKLEEVIKKHMCGTKGPIFKSENGLIWAGTDQTQLTWMDVKVEGWIPIKRHGFAVEINALWYNALCIMEIFSNICGGDSSYYFKEASAVKEAYEDLFWNEEKEYLNDVVRENYVETALKPNQILAVSLPFELLDEDKSKLVVDKILSKLYTPLGLRTLENDDINYEPYYEGCALERDGAYHRGTVWPWLLGEWIKAYTSVYGLDEFVSQIGFDAIEMNLKEGGIGSIGEIYEGMYPHIGRGCFAQAWSIGTILESYILFDKGVEK